MPLPQKLGAFVRSVLFGDPFGATHPPKALPPPATTQDGRTAGLEILKQYIAGVVFYRQGGLDPVTDKACPPIPFQIPPESIHVEWPDNEEDLTFPSVVLLSAGEGDYAMIGLTGYVEENTKDVYAPGTVVQWQYEHTELIALEVWGSTKSERRAMLAMLKRSLTPTEQMYGVRFRMPDYFDQQVCFTPMSQQIYDEADAVRNRRRARIVLEMRYNEVDLVNYNVLNVVMKTEVNVDEDTGLDVVLDAPPARAAKRSPDLPPLEPCGPTEIFTGHD